MKRMILAIILGVCLVGSLVWGFSNYTEVGELKQAEMQLRMALTEQREEADHYKSEWASQRERAFFYEDRAFSFEYEIVQLEGELEYLNKELAEGLLIVINLTSENDRLERQVRSLKENIEVWDTAYNDLQADYNQLTEQMENVDYLQYLLQLLL